MTTLAELARLIRSKNAGPFQLTFDIMFDEVAQYERARDSGAFTREHMADLFHQPPADVDIYFCEHARAVKISMPRPCSQGDLEDSDSHGGQQYAPLMDIEIA
ncbi:acyl-CoA synthetase [Agaricicola taiwanensis]|uniref:Acyl-CoA synthetase n=1 Tax=Agaricicola taiwanensis TaxID=591372 RepID=A0A8J2VE73_9RHOB|nr:DUF4387 domain-containing protein [Agaricicola taiwanensis]GGE28410.1 acyl-CoA synthetase [Agaricicola taiwanensis]